MASLFVEIKDWDTAYKYSQAGLLVNNAGGFLDSSGRVGERISEWLEPKTGGGGYVYVETDEDC